MEEGAQPEAPGEDAGCPGSTNYCAKAPGACEEAGVCSMKSQACPMIYDPVCGCDDQSYSNSCLAASAGVNVDYDGNCL